MKDRYGMTVVDFKKIGYKDEPFVLAKDVTKSVLCEGHVEQIEEVG